MIGYLKGKVLNLSSDVALIEVNGVGYEVCCSGRALSEMREGATCELYTYLQISEASGVSLFGFSSREEKAMFLKLISVSGVGAKMGIAVLTYMNVDEFVTAVATSDVKRLTSVKGLGKKTAERIILELRENVAADIAATPLSSDGGVMPSVSSGDEDAVVALMTLGFTRAESERAISRAKQSGAKTVEDIIMVALKGM